MLSLLLEYNFASIITARVRSTREGNIYTWECLSVHRCRGVPHPRSGGYPISGLAGGGTPSQVWLGGYPISGLGGPPSQVRGVPHLRSGGTPSQVGGTKGTPHPDLRWGNPPT